MSASLLLIYVLAALVLQVGVAATMALWRRRAASPAHGVAAQATEPAPGTGSGWRDLRVTRREYEDDARTLCSFYLEPVDGAPLPPFLAGQFLTFAVPVDAERTLTRCYSLSDRPNPTNYRITVKRVAAPEARPELPRGACSNYLHEQLQIGDVIAAKAPAGRFVVDPEPGVPIVLVAGGIGITPFLSMLRAGLAAEPNRAVQLYYGVRRETEEGFRNELEELAARHPSLHLNVVYSQPEPGSGDTSGAASRQTGRVDIDLLRRTLPAGRHRFYVCGPPPMMASLLPALLQWGVRPEDIHCEAFGPAAAPPRAASSQGTLPLEVVFRRSGRTLAWDGEDANLLDFAERHGVSVESGCRSGSCGACEAAVVSGAVRYPQPPDHDITPGHCLLCVGVPAGPLELEA